jgi:hypothetical protein
MAQTAHTDHFANFAEFYPFYLALATGDWLWLPAALVSGYGCAWIGHFFFEKNRPATFRHPIYSLMGDWVMFKDICVGKISL